jgi:cytochrome c oxidase subunit 1
MVSQIVATFTGRPVFGYPVMVAALVATGTIGFGLWVHHMFATTVHQLGQSFFHSCEHDHRNSYRCSDFLLARDDLLGRPRWKTPLLFVAVHRGVHDRRAHGRDARVGLIRSSGAGHLLRGGHLHYSCSVAQCFRSSRLYYWYPKATGE